MTRVLICGGRHFNDGDAIFAKLNSYAQDHDFTMVISGGASATWDQYSPYLGDYAAVIDFSDSFQLLKSAPRGSGAEAAAVPDGAQAGRSLAAQAVVSFGTDEWVAVAPGEDVADAFAALEAAPASEGVVTLPGGTALGAAYPNPFNPTATVPFHIAQAGAVRLSVYDVLGREVARLADGRVEAGRHTAVFDASRLPSGTYFVRLTTADGFAATQRITLLK